LDLIKIVTESVLQMLEVTRAFDKKGRYKMLREWTDARRVRQRGEK
jgi:hypothetical protein